MDGRYTIQRSRGPESERMMYFRFLLGLYWGYIGIMETTGLGVQGFRFAGC